jgi:hypothetical protein
MAIIIGQLTPEGTGGNSIYKSGVYTIHEFSSTGTFTPAQNTRVDILTIGGGGSRGPGGGPSWGSGGGGGAVMMTKFVPMNSGSPYTMTIGAANGDTTANYEGGSFTAPAGAQGRPGVTGTNTGNSAPLASGSGGTGWNTSNGGTGANIAGQGFPGFQDAWPGAGGDSGAGGGAGSGGPVTTAGRTGGNGTPLAYFTGITTHTNASAGGPGRGGDQTPRTGIQYGNGGGAHPPGSDEGTQPAQPGAIFIRYI